MKISNHSKYVLLNTVFVGDNFGSSLQAFALKRFVEDNLHLQCIIVERQEKGKYAKLLKLKAKCFNFFKSFISPRLFVLIWSSQLEKFHKRRKGDTYSNKIQEQFKNFTRSHIQPTYLTNKELKTYARNKHCVKCITGSDQIWNPTPIALRSAHFLQFSPKSKNISYAASIGASTIPYYNYWSFKRLIKNIEMISVREQTAQQLLENEFGLKSQICVDPVVLVGKDFWHSNRETIEANQPFTFCYFLNKPSIQAIRIVKKKIEDHEKVIVLSRKDFSQYDLDVQQLNDVTPLQFVTYIFESECILTDSFHGTIFSVLLNKLFFVFERDYENSVPQTSRIVTLLDQLGISERYVHGNITIPQIADIDYESVNDIIEKKRDFSMKFLSDAIQNE